MKYLYIVLFNGLIYAAFGWWTTNTETGRGLKHYLQNWKSDSLLHLVMVAVSIFIWGTAAILGLGLGLQALGF